MASDLTPEALDAYLQRLAKFMHEIDQEPSQSQAANPPAFPTQIDGVNVHGESGMSLRDWLAGQALNGMLADGEAAGAGVLGAAVARRAFEMADAMLAERKRS